VRSSLQKRENGLGYLLILPAMLASMALFLIPYLYSIGLSFFNYNLSRGGGKFIGLNNYISYFTNPTSQRILINSLIFVFVTLPLIILIAFALASLMHADFKGKRAYRTFNILPWVVSGTSASFMFMWLFDESSGLINVVLKALGTGGAHWLSEPVLMFVVIMYASLWKAVPFTFLLFLSGMQNIPKEYYEAVDVDGGGYFSKLRAITLPFLKRQFKLAMVYTTLGLLNTVDIMHAIGGASSTMKVIGYSMYTEAFKSFNISKSAAISVIMLAMNIIFAVVYMKLFKINAEEDLQ
jgi:multiple sugar transport system permease protein